MVEIEEYENSEREEYENEFWNRLLAGLLQNRCFRQKGERTEITPGLLLDVNFNFYGGISKRGYSIEQYTDSTSSFLQYTRGKAEMSWVLKHVKKAWLLTKAGWNL
jgi:hypothetical protein